MQNPDRTLIEPKTVTSCVYVLQFVNTISPSLVSGLGAVRAFSPYVLQFVNTKHVFLVNFATATPVYYPKIGQCYGEDYHCVFQNITLLCVFGVLNDRKATTLHIITCYIYIYIYMLLFAKIIIIMAVEL